MEVIKLKEHYHSLILKYFPPGELLEYKNFICNEIVSVMSNSFYKVNKVFELISSSWTEIDWKEIKNFKYHDYDKTEDIGYCIMDDINRASFIHVFPSLLCLLNKGEDDMAINHFISSHLDLRGVFRDWELEYYFSFNDEIVKLINSLLLQYDNSDNSDARNAVEVYWHTSS
jgi:hypothetical protein